MLYLFGRLALSDSYYFQQEEEDFDYQQKMKDRRSEGLQPAPRAVVADRSRHQDHQDHQDHQISQASCSAADRAN